MPPRVAEGRIRERTPRGPGMVDDGWLTAPPWPVGCRRAESPASKAVTGLAPVVKPGRASTDPARPGKGYDGWLTLATPPGRCHRTENLASTAVARLALVVLSRTALTDPRAAPAGVRWRPEKGRAE